MNQIARNALNVVYTNDISLEQRYAVAYWDQRNSGNTQGGANHDELNLATMTKDLKHVVLTLKNRYGADKSVFLYGHSFGGCLLNLN
jgi:proline iminopeptidase